MSRLGWQFHPVIFGLVDSVDESKLVVSQLCFLLGFWM